MKTPMLSKLVFIKHNIKYEDLIQRIVKSKRDSGIIPREKVSFSTAKTMKPKTGEITIANLTGSFSERRAKVLEQQKKK